MKYINSIDEFTSFVSTVKSDENKRYYPAGTIVVIEGERLCKNVGMAYSSAHKLLGTGKVAAATVGGAGAAGFLASGAALLGGPLTVLAVGGAATVGYFKTKAKRDEHMCLPYAQDTLDLLNNGFDLLENNYSTIKLRRS